MLGEPGASVTHTESHAELTQGKPPPIDPALGLPCPTAPVVCAGPGSLCSPAVPSGCEQGPLCPLLPRTALPGHCHPCMEGSAASTHQAALC